MVFSRSKTASRVSGSVPFASGAGAAGGGGGVAGAGAAIASSCLASTFADSWSARARIVFLEDGVAMHPKYVQFLLTALTLSQMSQIRISSNSAEVPGACSIVTDRLFASIARR